MQIFEQPNLGRKYVALAAVATLHLIRKQSDLYVPKMVIQKGDLIFEQAFGDLFLGGVQRNLPYVLKMLQEWNDTGQY